MGYVRVATRFFGASFHPADGASVAPPLGYALDQIDLAPYDAQASARRHRRLTLDDLGCRPFHAQAREDSAHEIRTRVRSHLRPPAIFCQVLTLLEARQTDIPRASALTALNTHERHHHQRQLTHTIAAHLAPTHRALLDALLAKHEALWPSKPHSQRDQLTFLQRCSPSTKPAKIKTTIEDLRLVRPLSQEMAAVAEALDLTPAGVRYYANAVLKSPLFQVARRAEDQRHLPLVCVIPHPCLRLRDVLIAILRLSVQRTLRACERADKDRCYTGRTDQRQAWPTWAEEVRERIGNPLAAIETIAFRAQRTETEKGGHLQAILAPGQEQRRALTSQLLEVPPQSPETNEDSAYPAVLEAQSLNLHNRVADIVQARAVQGEDQAALLPAVQYDPQKQGAITPTAPMACCEP